MKGEILYINDTHLCQSVSIKYLRINHFWIDDDITLFVHTCVIDVQDFLNNRFGGDFDFGCYDTLRQKRVLSLKSKVLF